MNIKTTAILFGLLCGALAVFGLFQLLGVKTREERLAAAKQVLPTLRDLVKQYDNDGISMGPMAKVESDAKYKLFDRITIERAAKDGKPAEKFDFQRQGAEWKIVAPLAVRTDSQAVCKIIDQLSLAERDSQADLPPNLAEYGLDKPTCVVKLYRGDQVFSLTIGKPGPMIKDATTQQDRPIFYYVVSSDLPSTPMTVQTSSLQQLLAPLATFRDRKVFRSAFFVQEVALGGTQREPMTLVGIAEKQPGMPSTVMSQPTRWEFGQPRLGDADTNAITALSRDVGGLRIDKDEDFIQDGVASAEQLAKFGLSADKPEYSLTLKTGTPGSKEVTTETLLIGKPVPLFPTERLPLWCGANLAVQAPSALFADPVSWLTAVAFMNQPEAISNGLYARMADSASVFRIDNKILPHLKKTADDIRSRALTRLNLGKLDAIDVTIGNETLQFRRQVLSLDGTSPSDWDLYRPGKGKVKTDPKAVEELIGALHKVDVRDNKHFLDDAKHQEEFKKTFLGKNEQLQMGLDKPLAVITLWQEGIERDKDGKPTGTEATFKKDVKPTVKLTISPRNADYGLVFVKREVGDQSPAILAIKDGWHSIPQPQNQPGMPPQQQESVRYSLSELASGGYLHYRDHSLPGIPLDQAEQMTVERGATKYVVEHAVKKEQNKPPVDVWSLKQPVEGPCPNAPIFLSFLGQINARLMRADQATPAQWEEYGLGAKPWMRVALQSFEDDKKKRDTYTLLIGKQTSDKDKDPQHYYARIEFTPKEGKPAEANGFVFLVPPEVVKSLDLELRQPTVFPRVMYTSLFPIPQEGSVHLEQISLTWNTVDKDKKPHVIKLSLAEVADKDGKKSWTVQSYTDNGADLKAQLPQVDVMKIAQLFHERGGLIHQVQTERFLIHNGKPTPDQRLDPASKDHPPALIVEAKLSNGITRTLILGAEFTPKEEEHPFLAGRTFRLGWASSQPNAVFLVNPTVFEALLKGPEFFKPAVPVAPAAPAK